MSNDQPNITTIDRGDLTLHIFTSPEVGEMVNSHVIETANALVVIDVPVYAPFGSAFRAYIDSLDKPIAKLLITHAHPDHWFTLTYFKDHQSFAFSEVIDEMNLLKDLAVGFHRSTHPDLVPDEVLLPTDTIDEGPITVDGVTFNLQKLFDVEANCTMVVEIPSINTLIAQDLVYNRCYLYVASRTADGGSTIPSWIRQLEMYRENGYELVLPGHGLPTDSTIFDDNIEYLTFAQEVVDTAADGEALIGRFKAQYPDYQLELTLTMSAIMLYPPDAG